MHIHIYETESVSCSVISDFLQPHAPFSPPGSSVHGILQARILDWVAIPLSRSNPDLPHCRQILYHLSHREAVTPSKGFPGQILNKIWTHIHPSTYRYTLSFLPCFIFLLSTKYHRPMLYLVLFLFYWNRGSMGTGVFSAWVNSIYPGTYEV